MPANHGCYLKACPLCQSKAPGTPVPEGSRAKQEHKGEKKDWMLSALRNDTIQVQTLPASSTGPRRINLYHFTQHNEAEGEESWAEAATATLPSIPPQA